jgi:DNA-binding MarR family transcriptional regulator
MGSEHRIVLREKMRTLSMLMTRFHYQMFAQHGRFSDYTRGQGRVLVALKLKQSMTQKELCRVLDIRNQSLGELLGKLEKGGYVTRAPAEADKRTVVVTITPAGMEAAANIVDPKDEMHRLMPTPAPAEAEAIGSYLDKVIVQLRERLGESDPLNEPSLQEMRNQLHKMMHEHHG